MIYSKVIPTINLFSTTLQLKRYPAGDRIVVNDMPGYDP